MKAARRAPRRAQGRAGRMGFVRVLEPHQVRVIILMAAHWTACSVHLRGQPRPPAHVLVAEQRAGTASSTSIPRRRGRRRGRLHLLEVLDAVPPVHAGLRVLALRDDDELRRQGRATSASRCCGVPSSRSAACTRTWSAACATSSRAWTRPRPNTSSRSTCSTSSRPVDTAAAARAARDYSRTCACFRERRYNSPPARCRPRPRRVARVATAGGCATCLFNCEDASSAAFVVALALALELGLRAERAARAHARRRPHVPRAQGLVIVGKSDLFGTALPRRRRVELARRLRRAGGPAGRGRGSRRVLGAGHFFGEDMVVNERHTFDATAPPSSTRTRRAHRAARHPAARHVPQHSPPHLAPRRDRALPAPRLGPRRDGAEGRAEAGARKVRAARRPAPSRDAIKAEIAQLRGKGHLLSARRRRRGRARVRGRAARTARAHGARRRGTRRARAPVLKIWSGIRALRDKDDDGRRRGSRSKAAASSAIRHLQRLRRGAASSR